MEEMNWKIEITNVVIATKRSDFAGSMSDKHKVDFTSECNDQEKVNKDKLTTAVAMPEKINTLATNLVCLNFELNGYNTTINLETERMTRKNGDKSP